VLDARRLTAGLILGILLSLGGGAMAMGSGAGGVGLGLGALLCFLAVLLFTLGSRATVTAFALLTPLGRTTVTLTGAALTTCAAAGLNALLGGAAPQWAFLGFNELAALALFSIGGLAISQLHWIMSVGNLGIALSSLQINATPFYVMGTLFALGGAWNWTQAWAAAVVALGVLVAQGIVRLGPAGTGSAQAP
jgi:drug/metabolite transporter (DMT)-like permease